MKLVVLLLLLQSCRSFALRPFLSAAVRLASHLRAVIVELEPEPVQGEELIASTTLPRCRMKLLEPIANAKSSTEAYIFWMTAEVDGALFKEIRAQILKDASRKANFPGFRKVSLILDMRRLLS
jgi:hypothetical protein